MRSDFGRLLASQKPAIWFSVEAAHMYIARFSYAVLPVNRQRAIDSIHREVKAAARVSLKARLLEPLTRGSGGASLQFEVELKTLDQFDKFRDRGIASQTETGKWMRAFSKILVSPPQGCPIFAGQTMVPST